MYLECISDLDYFRLLSSLDVHESKKAFFSCKKAFADVFNHILQQTFRFKSRMNQHSKRRARNTKLMIGVHVCIINNFKATFYYYLCSKSMPDIARGRIDLIKTPVFMFHCFFEIQDYLIRKLVMVCFVCPNNNTLPLTITLTNHFHSLFEIVCNSL